MKKVKFRVFAVSVCFFMSMGLSSMLYAVDCSQEGDCISCEDWGGWIEPNFCRSGGNNCQVVTTTCGHPMQ